MNKKVIHLIPPAQLQILNERHNERLQEKRVSHPNYNSLVHNFQLYREANQNHLQLSRQALTNINKENQQTVNLKFFNIAKSNNYDPTNIFGPYIQSNNTSANFGRQIMPPRHLKCPFGLKKKGINNLKNIYIYNINIYIIELFIILAAAPN
jgi:hypothetical protein